MKTQLPMFEGMHAVSAMLRVSGKSAEHVGALEVGEEVFIVLRAYVSGVDHEATEVGLERRHTVKAQEMVLITRADGQRMLDEAHALSDERFGLQHMFGDPDTGEIRE